jgi:hypothetical protein
MASGSGKGFSRSSLTRLVAAVFILNLFVIGMSSFFLVRSYQQERDKTALVADNMSRELDENLSRLIDKIDLTLLAVADEAERQLGAGAIDRPSFEAFLARHDHRLPESNGLRVANAQGWVEYAVSNVASSNNDVSDREYFTRHRDDPDLGLFISTPFFGRISNEPLIMLSRRYRSADGSFGGTVGVAVAVRSLQAILSTVDVGSSGNVSLWDSSVCRATNKLRNERQSG